MEEETKETTETQDNAEPVTVHLRRVNDEGRSGTDAIDKKFLPEGFVKFREGFATVKMSKEAADEAVKLTHEHVYPWGFVYAAALVRKPQPSTVVSKFTSEVITPKQNSVVEAVDEMVYMSREEIIEQLQVSPQKIGAQVRAGKIKVVKDPEGTLYYDRADVAEFAKSLSGIEE